MKTQPSSTNLHPRQAFTLLELITAMLASTTLIVALAATVAISTQLMEVPPADESAWQDRHLYDRIASDLRYATQVRELSDGFEITQPNPMDGSLRTIKYQSGDSGLTRQIEGDSVFSLDDKKAKPQLIVDGYSAPTNPTPDNYVRIRSVSTAFNDSLATSWTVDVPAGAKAGDLILLCISARSLNGLGASGSWRVLSFDNTSDLRMVVAYSTYNDNWSPTVTVSTSSASAFAVALVVVENVDTSLAFPWSITSQGYAETASSSTFPQVQESPDIEERQLNLQVFAAVGDPWHDGALGVAGFTDVLQLTTMPDDSSYQNTLAIAVRNGATPSMSLTPRTNHQTDGYWLQCSATLELAP